LDQNQGVGRCESCLYFDYDEETDQEICTMNLDEDEMERLVAGRYPVCPYYRFYDEYKFVQKQN
jgi:hypothetical protein